MRFESELTKIREEVREWKRVERGEVPLRSDIVYVYRMSLPHNKLLLASVREFYTAGMERCLGSKREGRTSGGAAG